MKTIETPRLLLRRLTVKDYDEIFKHYTPRDAMLFLGMKTEEEYQSFKKKYDAGLENYRSSFVAFQLIEKDSANIIGDCSFHTWQKAHSRAEVGYGINDEQFKQQGYMREALRAVVDYGFAEMKLNRIEAYVSTQNIASQKLVMNMGFVQEGLLREHYCKDGVLEDSLVFGLLKKDYKF